MKKLNDKLTEMKIFKISIGLLAYLLTIDISSALKISTDSIPPGLQEMPMYSSFFEQFYIEKLEPIEEVLKISVYILLITYLLFSMYFYREMLIKKENTSDQKKVTEKKKMSKKFFKYFIAQAIFIAFLHILYHLGNQLFD